VDNQQITTWFRYKPWAYTEEGVAMVAGILNTPQAVEASVSILRLFRDTRKALNVSRKLLDVVHNQLENAHQELLKVNPKWKKILRYRRLGLSQRDIGKLLGVTQRCVWGHLARMKQCGLIATTGALVPRH
jgi:DNA-binding NarL/FixJ family response regulator